MNSLGSRVAGTIITGVCWLSFIILFFVFLAGNFDLLQNIAIFIVSLLIAGGILTVIWTKWVLK